MEEAYNWESGFLFEAESHKAKSALKCSDAAESAPWSAGCSCEEEEKRRKSPSESRSCCKNELGLDSHFIDFELDFHPDQLRVCEECFVFLMSGLNKRQIGKILFFICSI